MFKPDAAKCWYYTGFQTSEEHNIGLSVLLIAPYRVIINCRRFEWASCLQNVAQQLQAVTL